MNKTHFLYMGGFVATWILALCLSSCKDTFHEPADRLTSDKIIADYITKELKGKPYTLYLYTDTTSYHLRLTDNDRYFESGRSYVYFIDEDPTFPWPHPCRSVWIDRDNSSFSVQRGENPLRGTGKWLLINNLWNEPPRTGSSDCIQVGHPDHIIQPCLYYQFDGDNLSMEHQCIEMSSSAVELSILIDQSNHSLDLVMQDAGTTDTGSSCIRNYGFGFHLDSLYVPIDSANIRRLEQIPVHYRVSTANGIIDKSFTLPTDGKGKIRL